MTDSAKNMKRAAEIVRDAGGKIVGRTRLQKIAYLLELSELGSGYRFEYRYYGPYSKELAEDVSSAWAYDLLTETERPASWGGTYSIFEATPEAGTQESGPRSQFAQEAANIDAIELELAATAAFLHAGTDCKDPWEETQRRKPDKATKERLAAAKKAYSNLRQLQIRLNLPTVLPDIA